VIGDNSFVPTVRSKGTTEVSDHLKFFIVRLNIILSGTAAPEVPDCDDVDMAAALDENDTTELPIVAAMNRNVVVTIFFLKAVLVERLTAIATAPPLLLNLDTSDGDGTTITVLSTLCLCCTMRLYNGCSLRPKFVDAVAVMLRLHFLVQVEDLTNTELYCTLLLARSARDEVRKNGDVFFETDIDGDPLPPPQAIVHVGQSQH
jgi:hypothetical protein